jgi:hypothetical protein
VIVYNVKRRWFAMKGDAEAYRRSEKLPPEATFTLKIEERESLAALLNGLCGIEPPPFVAAGAFSTLPNVEPLPRVAEMIVRNSVMDDIPDCVPQFLRREWEAKMKGRAS